MTKQIKKLDPDAAIDIAYDIFLEMAPENLDPADILLFNMPEHFCNEWYSDLWHLYL